MHRSNITDFAECWKLLMLFILLLPMCALNFYNIFILSQVRVNKEQDHVLISPRGLSFAEVTAANLVSTMAECLSFF